jgi:hypothetical protein
VPSRVDSAGQPSTPSSSRAVGDHHRHLADHRGFTPASAIVDERSHVIADRLTAWQAQFGAAPARGVCVRPKAPLPCIGILVAFEGEKTV